MARVMSRNFSSYYIQVQNMSSSADLDRSTLLETMQVHYLTYMIG